MVKSRMESQKQDQTRSQQHQQFRGLSPELIATMTSVAKALEEAARNSLPNMTAQATDEASSTTPSSWMSSCADPRSSADAPTTQESKCFTLADKVIGDGMSGICAICESRLAPHQRLAAMSKRAHFGVSSADCCICQMKTLTPESFTKPFCQFLTDNPTIFHAVAYFKEKMNAVGFTEVMLLFYIHGDLCLQSNSRIWSLASGTRRLVREDSTRREILCDSKR